MEAAAAVETYFRDLLMPRNHGLIAVAELSAKKTEWGGPPRRADANGFLVCLSTEPFLEINFDDGGIVLHVNYPRTIAVWDDRKKQLVPGAGTIKPLSKRAKERWATVKKLGTSRVVGGQSIRFELCDPDSLGRAEFFVQTIITKIKYMVTNSGWKGLRPKDLDFDDLIDAATRDYNRKVIAPTIRAKRHKFTEAV